MIEWEAEKHIVVLKSNYNFCEFVRYLESVLDYHKKQMIYVKDDVLMRIHQGKSQALYELLELINNAEKLHKNIKENGQQ